VPIAKKELNSLKKNLGKLKHELEVRFKVVLHFAEYNPQPSSLFEYFVLFNAAIATNPKELILNRLTRGNFRSVGFLPIPALRSYRTVWKMGDTLKPTIITRNSKQLNYWFDRSIAKRLRPDIVVRTGKYFFKSGSNSHVKLFKDKDVFAEYSDDYLEEKPGYFVEKQKMSWSDGRQSSIYFRAKEEFNYPELIIECKSFGARLGNPQKYSKFGKQVIIVSPEPLYEPKASNIYIIRIAKDFNNLEIREKLNPFLEKI